MGQVFSKNRVIVKAFVVENYYIIVTLFLYYYIHELRYIIIKAALSVHTK